MHRTWHIALFLGVLPLTGFGVWPTPGEAAYALVQIMNAESTSVPIHDAGQLQPVFEAVAVHGDAIGNHLEHELYTVPAGKRLVMEMFSYFLRGDDAGLNGVPIAIALGTDVTYVATAEHGVFLAPVLSGTNPGGTHYYADARAVRLYFDAGQTISVRLDFKSANQLDQKVQFSGFLVTK